MGDILLCVRIIMEVRLTADKIPPLIEAVCEICDNAYNYAALSLYSTRTQKTFALGTFDTKYSTFASGDARNTNMLVSLALGDANFLRRPCTFHFLCVDFFALGSKRKPHFQWNIGCVGSLALGLCVGHVHFMR